RHRGRPVRGGLRAVARPARRAPTRAIAGRCGHRTLAGGGRATGVAQGGTGGRSRGGRGAAGGGRSNWGCAGENGGAPSSGPLTGSSGGSDGAPPAPPPSSTGRPADRRIWRGTGGDAPVGRECRRVC